MLYFWNSWNIPMHKWIFRHLFIPSVNCGFSQFQALSFSFLFSGLFHEGMASIPLKRFYFWWLIILTFQIPLLFIGSKINLNYRNFILWIMVILFFPYLYLLYFSNNYKQFITINTATIWLIIPKRTTKFNCQTIIL